MDDTFDEQYELSILVKKGKWGIVLTGKRFVSVPYTFGKCSWHILEDWVIG